MPCICGLATGAETNKSFHRRRRHPSLIEWAWYVRLRFDIPAIDALLARHAERLPRDCPSHRKLHSAPSPTFFHTIDHIIPHPALLFCTTHLHLTTCINLIAAAIQSCRALPLSGSIPPLHFIHYTLWVSSSGPLHTVLFCASVFHHGLGSRR